MSKYLYISGGSFGADYAALSFENDFPKEKYMDLWLASNKAGKELDYEDEENNLFFGYEAMELDEKTVEQIQANMDYDSSKFENYYLVELEDDRTKLVYEKVKSVKDPKFSNGNAGIDLFIPDMIEYSLFSSVHAVHGFIPFLGKTDQQIHLKPGDSIKIAAGLKFDIPEGYALDFLNKSGIALSGLTIGSELIDSSYTGEVNFHLIAHRPFTIEPGMKIVQAVIIKDYVPEFSIKEGTVDKVTDRGEGGFGSTGIK